MKTTYLVFKDADAKRQQLVVATKEEWDAIMKANRQLPNEQRRYFKKDCIMDSSDWDCMFIEATKEEFDEWHSKHEYANQKRAYEHDYSFVSLESDMSNDVELTGSDVISSDFNLEQTVIQGIMLEGLRTALSEWRFWAVEMLDYYLSGQKYSCSKKLIDKYGVSYKTVAKWKSQFENFAKTYLS